MSAAVCFLILVMLYTGVGAIQAVRYLCSLVAGTPDESTFQSGLLATGVADVWLMLLALCQDFLRRWNAGEWDGVDLDDVPGLVEVWMVLPGALHRDGEAARSLVE